MFIRYILNERILFFFNLISTRCWTVLFVSELNAILPSFKQKKGNQTPSIYLSSWPCVLHGKRFGWMESDCSLLGLLLLLHLKGNNQPTHLGWNMLTFSIRLWNCLEHEELESQVQSPWETNVNEWKFWRIQPHSQMCPANRAANNPGNISILLVSRYFNIASSGTFWFGWCAKTSGRS